ncbi:PucR family transcriptional regulator [Geodermatophilus sp. TF02-6]|uniref:PucR family transcriptional regulator n=1 Tax=Geodermatophilus sp. TF02-6 TaxID=2250575 RepID=UPI000DE8D9F6|nr:PucR family transcriptional regulator [Geodermatophilus sp. TF02-6]RBY83784.1 PucR family transcriptional regulator [Geodermatophilus sp. TF02-6]
MHLTLEGVLRHPILQQGQPCVRAGATGLQRRVRWIHSSEVMEIASLLRGGELLLTGGEMLAGASAADQRRYVRQLSERSVTGVAIEVGVGLPAIPAAVISEADDLGFPVIELRRRVPFVDVAEAVNAELVDESVTRLRRGGELAHALSGILGRGGDVRALLELLEQRTGVPVALFDSRGRVITEFPTGTAAAAVDPPVPPHGGTTSRISVRGAHAATLVFYPDADTDPDLLAIVGERASEAIVLALMRSHPPSTRDFAASELARTACRRPQERDRLIHLGQLIGFDPGDPVVAIAMVTAATSAGLPGLDVLLRRSGRIAMDVSDTEVRAVVSLPDRRGAATNRTALVARLEDWARDLDAVVVGVGPAVPDLASVFTSMELAVSSAQQRPAYGPGSVVDATTTAIETLLGAEDLRFRREQFVRGQLAMLLSLRPTERETLLHTLEVYLDSGCSKTRTAEVLHLQRQSLYGRLERAFGMVGGDPTGTERALPLHLALRLRHGLHHLAHQHPAG